MSKFPRIYGKLSCIPIQFSFRGALLDGLLLLAVSKKVFSLIPLLLQMGADPNSRNEDGKTVVMHMMTFKFEESIEYIDMLYRAGANINAVSTVYYGLSQDLETGCPNEVS